MAIAKIANPNRMKHFRTIAGIVILTLTIAAVLPRAPQMQKKSDKVKVVTTIFPLYDFTKNIGKDWVEVSLLLPPGTDMHSFEPKPSDIVTIRNADVFVYAGDEVEPWVEDILKSVTGESTIVIDASKNILFLQDSDHDHAIDPHYWLDFANAQTMVGTISSALIKADTAHASDYGANARQYQKALAYLDQEFATGLISCANRQIIYGGHYALGYLAQRYNLQYLAAQGFIPDSEPTAPDLIRLVEQIREQNVRFVFYEELSSPKIAETLARETNTQLLPLYSAHNVAKKDLENDRTFLSIMQENLKNLRIGLQCTITL